MLSTYCHHHIISLLVVFPQLQIYYSRIKFVLFNHLTNLLFRY